MPDPAIPLEEQIEACEWAATRAGNDQDFVREDALRAAADTLRKVQAERSTTTTMSDNPSGSIPTKQELRTFYDTSNSDATRLSAASKALAALRARIAELKRENDELWDGAELGGKRIAALERELAEARAALREQRKNVLREVSSEWDTTMNDNETCHSRMIGGVLCRWWGDGSTPEGVKWIDDAAPAARALPKGGG